MSDIWEWLYNAYGINPKRADPDGDGFSNLQESIAGTNPFNSNSYPYIPCRRLRPTNFSVTLPCALGKQYQLQSITALAARIGWWKPMWRPARDQCDIDRADGLGGEILSRRHFGRGFGRRRFE
jgi:hypothetical protein